MPITWYKLVAGPAPWEDQTSYTEGSIINGITVNSGRTSSSESYSRDVDSSFSISDSNSNYETGGVASNVNDFTFSNDNYGESGSTLTGGEEFFSASQSSSSGRTFAYISHETNGATRGATSVATGSGSYSSTGKIGIQGTRYTYSNSYYATYADSYTETNITKSYSFSTSGTANIYPRVVTRATTTVSIPIQSGGIGTIGTYDATTQISTSISTSTDGTDSTSPTSTYDTTCITYTSTNYTTTNYATWMTTVVGYAYKTFITGAFHAEPVIQATPDEVLYLKTATGSNYALANVGLGPSFTITTLNSALSQTTYEVAYSDTYSYGAATFVSYGISYQYITENRPARSYLPYSATLQQAGTIGGSSISTYENPMALLTIGTSDFVTVRTNITNKVVTTYSAAYYPIGIYSPNGTSISWINAGVASLTQENITYNTPNGGTAIGQVYTTFYYDSWVSIVSSLPFFAVGSITRYLSPAGANYGQADPQLTRMNRQDGFQAPNGMGLLGKQGRSINANRYLPIGAYNFSQGSPNILAPWAKYSTAEEGASSFSFSISSDGNWQVSMQSSDGTLTTYTASVNVAGEEIYRNGYADGNYYNSPVTAFAANAIPIFGGPNAYLNAGQNITIEGGGAAYTIGDGGFTRSSAEIFPQPYKTISLSSSIIAVDTFRTCMDSPVYYGGLPVVITRAYSSP